MSKYINIKKEFEKHSNKDKAKKMSAYMKDNFKFYGLSSPERRSLYKDFLNEEKKNKIIDWNFLDSCYDDEYREMQYLAADYLLKMLDFIKFEDIKKIEKYVKSKQWWDTIDVLDEIFGKIGLKDKRMDKLMLDWSTNEDFWIRRIAIDHQLLRKEKTNTDLLSKIIINNFGSDEFFINKAIGWSLRDYSKTNPTWVKNFISTHKDKMNSLSIREASKYI